MTQIGGSHQSFLPYKNGRKTWCYAHIPSISESKFSMVIVVLEIFLVMTWVLLFKLMTLLVNETKILNI